METKGISCKIPLDLHERISEEIRETESTMSQFIEMVIREHVEKGANKVMEKGKTLAFQVSEELFQKVKEYLNRYERIYHRRLTQKEFVIGLIEEALERAEGDENRPKETEFGAQKDVPHDEPRDEDLVARDAEDGEDEAGESEDESPVQSWGDAVYSEEAESDEESDEADKESEEGQEDAL